MKHQRLRIEISGLVQGMGFRPTVFKYAVATRLSGFVCNSSDGVTIEVEGLQIDIQQFKDDLFSNLPTPARIIAVSETSVAVTGDLEFRIVRSSTTSGSKGFNLLRPVLADIALCNDCRRELSDPKDRRYLYPLINCQNCGPRATIIKTLPYDRKRTVMSSFKMCPHCRREYNDPADRRHHAEPCACHVCGPRLDLILKKDFSKTALDGLTLSKTGYQQHRLLTSMQLNNDDMPRDAESEIKRIQKLLDKTVRLLQSGKIVAIKGLGGFLLVCDATNDLAVARLRKRKKRSNKPFAVMYPAIKMVKSNFFVSQEEVNELSSAASPIVILREKRHQDNMDKFSAGESVNGQIKVAKADPGIMRVSENVAPGLSYQGVMLPYTPLQEILLRAAGRPLVMTSANLSDEPIAIANEEAITGLAQVADAFLVHDRKIIDRYDDSLVFFSGADRHVMRRARGLAPLPLENISNVFSTSSSIDKNNSNTQMTVFGAGADLKNSFCFYKNGLFFPSQHIGDLEYPGALDHYEQTIKRFRKFFDLRPELVAHDLHPDFFSTKVVQSMFPKTRTLAVQHHHAHIASVIAENVVSSVVSNSQRGAEGAFSGNASNKDGVDIRDKDSSGFKKNAKSATKGKIKVPIKDLTGPVIGIAFDGTGYGTDGNIWGGEFLLVDGLESKRVGHFKEFPIIGGDGVIKSPAKLAAQYLAYSLGEKAISHKNPVTTSYKAHEWAILSNRISKGDNLPMCSSVGRIFDIASALLGICFQATYEGEAAILLENIAETAGTDRHKQKALPFNIGSSNKIGSNNETLIIDLQEALIYLAEQGAKLEFDKQLSENIKIGSTSSHNTDPSSARTRARLAKAFMQTIVKSTSDSADHIRKRTGINVVCLSGGAFQNRFLLKNITSELENLNFTVYSNRNVPAGDGGIAVGQAYLAKLALLGSRVQR